MNQPQLNEYDSWRNSAVGIWFFEHVLQGRADAVAQVNGRGPGTFPTLQEDYMAYVKNAGHIDGIEYAINFDPFAEERYEITSDRQISAGED